jgi:uncharacterized protein
MKFNFMKNFIESTEAFPSSKEDEILEKVINIIKENPLIKISSDYHLLKWTVDEKEPVKGKEFRTNTDLEVVYLHNKNVKKDEWFFYLGDIAHRKLDKKYFPKLINIFQGLNGKKILLKGNHDVYSDEFYEKLGFSYVLPMSSLRIDNILFSHEPIDVEGTPLINIHGHLHECTTYTIPWKNHINVFWKTHKGPLTILDLLKLQKDGKCKYTTGEINVNNSSNLNLNTSLKDHVERDIIPLYKKFDSGHNEFHVRTVITRSLELLHELLEISESGPDDRWDHTTEPLDINIVYAAAAYHDLGLSNDRENHEMASGIIVSKSKFLPKIFDKEEIELIKEAVEDHRASMEEDPRSFYGRIISEADRNTDNKVMVLRSFEYNKEKYPNDTYEQILERMYKHLKEKFGYKYKYGNRLRLRLPSTLYAMEERIKFLRSKETFLKFAYSICKKF